MHIILTNKQVTLEALNMEKFQQWMSAIYAQNVEKYLKNESCYICTNCGECLIMVTTCMYNKCGKNIWESSLNELNVEKFEQWKSAIYAHGKHLYVQ